MKLNPTMSGALHTDENADVNRPEKIDLATWARAEHFAYYRTSVPCSYAVTVEIDVTALASALRLAGRRPTRRRYGLWRPSSTGTRSSDSRSIMTGPQQRGRCCIR